MKFKQQNGIYLPVEKEVPVKREPPKVWNCRYCGMEYDSTKPENEGREAYTVGSLNPKSIPHVRCPHCKECMGCLEIGR